MSTRSKSKRQSTGRKGGISQSMRAGITFPVGRVGRLMRSGKFSQRTGAGAPIFMAAVMEYICAEVLETSGDVC